MHLVLRFISRCGCAWALLMGGIIGMAGAAEDFRCVPPPVTGVAASNRASVALLEAFPAQDHAEQVTVLAADGTPVPAMVLSAALGEPVRVLVDARKGAPYRLVLGGGSGIGAEWTPPAGIVCEVRTRTGAAPMTRREAEHVWDHGRVIGRTVVERIFLGTNPCSADRDVCMRFSGSISVERAGRYGFATISNDASFLAVDGRPVAEWPGWHDVKSGRRAQHQGTVTLTPGVHQIDYLLVQHGDWICASVAWEPPEAARPDIMPAGAFLPVAVWKTEPVIAPDITWQPQGGAQIGDHALIEMRFTAHPVGDAVARWTFADGVTAVGNDIRSVFIDGGLRTVEVDLSGQQLKRTVAIHSRWLPISDWSDDELTKRCGELSKRDLSPLPAVELTALIGIATTLGERRLLESVTRTAMAHGGTDEAMAAVLCDLGLRWQQPAFRDIPRAESIWRRVLDSAAPGTWHERAVLHLAGLLLHQLDRAADARVLLDRLDPTGLSADERRLGIIYRGDVAVASQDPTTAQARYTEAGDAKTDVAQSVKRRARVAYARELVAKGTTADGDEAEQILRDLEWEMPSERLGTETGLAWVELWLVRNQPLAALSRCRLMLGAAGPDARRATVLYAMVRSAKAAGRRSEAASALGQLRADFPYSEAAAKAGELMR